MATTSKNCDIKTASLQEISLYKHKHDIYDKLCKSISCCKKHFCDTKILVTETNEPVNALLLALEDTFSYGLRQQEPTILSTATSLFQNMQEIVTGKAGSSLESSRSNQDTSFWDFCKLHLTPDEATRFEDLENVWTKHGRGRAFIRSSLNEGSLHRYLLIFLNAEEDLRRFYFPWALLLDDNMAERILNVISQLNDVLFAINVNASELNLPYQTVSSRVVDFGDISKEEPIIYAPKPVPASRKLNMRKKIYSVERPIATTNSTEDLLTLLKHNVSSNSSIENNDNIAESSEASIMSLSEYSNEVGSFINSSDECFFEHSQTAEIPVDCNISNEFSEDDKSSVDISSESYISLDDFQHNKTKLENKLKEMEEHCSLLEKRVAELTLENRQLMRRLNQQFKESGVDPSSSLTNNYLITIPRVQLVKGKAGLPDYHEYEIHITMRRHLEHWSVLRRYRDFYKLHVSLQKTHPSIKATIPFPPKKRFGNKDTTFVEERRQRLQIYLLNLVESIPQLESCKSKFELQKVFSFLRERKQI